MPRVSAKKKAIRAASRQNVLKRWKKVKDNGEPTCTAAGLEEQQVAGDPPTVASRFYPPPTQSAASFRHSLLPPELANVQEKWSKDYEVEISDCEADSRPETPKTSLEASTSCQTNEPTLVSNCTESGVLTKSKEPQRKHKVDQTDAVLSLIGEHFKLFPPEDDFDIMGKNFATALRHVAKDQRLYAVKLMNDVLFEAQLGNLNRHWTLSKPNKRLEGTFPQPEYLPQNSSLTTDVTSQSLSANDPLKARLNHGVAPSQLKWSRKLSTEMSMEERETSKQVEMTVAAFPLVHVDMENFSKEELNGNALVIKEHDVGEDFLNEDMDDKDEVVAKEKGVDESLKDEDEFHVKVEDDSYDYIVKEEVEIAERLKEEPVGMLAEDCNGKEIKEWYTEGYTIKQEAEEGL